MAPRSASRAQILPIARCDCHSAVAGDAFPGDQANRGKNCRPGALSIACDLIRQSGGGSEPSQQEETSA